MTKEQFEQQTGFSLIKKGNRLYYEGDLNLYNSKIETMPEHLTVNGNLDLMQSDIKFLPNDLQVNKNLDLRYTKIKSLPDYFHVGGNLDLMFSKIESLPINLTVDGDLDIEYTKINRLPDDLVVNGYNLYVSNEMTYNPEKIGFLFKKNVLNNHIMFYNIKKDFINCESFRDNFNEFVKTVYDEYPDLTNSYGFEYAKFIGECTYFRIKFLNKNIKMTKEKFKEITGIKLNEKDGKLYYDGDMVLESFLIKTLPDNLTVNGSLILTDSKIESLPNNLTVNGFLCLENTYIESLPDDLVVNGDSITITNPNIKYDPNEIGFLFSNCPKSNSRIICYNIKKDLIYPFSFDEYLKIKNDYNVSQDFIEQCAYYRKKYAQLEYFRNYYSKNEFSQFGCIKNGMLSVSNLEIRISDDFEIDKVDMQSNKITLKESDKKRKNDIKLEFLNKNIESAEDLSSNLVNFLMRMYGDIYTLIIRCTCSDNVHNFYNAQIYNKCTSSSIYSTFNYCNIKDLYCEVINNFNPKN